jgi:DNA-directed RNA polymerase subunit RPC12/RpoP
MTMMEPRGDEEDDEIILENGIKMEKEVKCLTCGTKIPLEIGEDGLIRLGSTRCPRCGRMRCPKCGFIATIEFSEKNDVFDAEFRCLSKECGFRKKILI